MSGPESDRDPALTFEDVELLRSLGYNQTEIARMFGVTRQYVSLVKRGDLRRQSSLNDFARGPREVAMDSFPWKPVGHPFTEAHLDKLLRDHAEYQATAGEGMSEDKLRRLRAFYRKLQAEDLVVEFHPAIPPNEYSPYGGYAYRPRTTADGELIIRVNALARMTPTGEVVWRFPRRLPDVD